MNAGQLLRTRWAARAIQDRDYGDLYELAADDRPLKEICDELRQQHVDVCTASEFLAWCEATETRFWGSADHMYHDYIECCAQIAHAPAHRNVIAKGLRLAGVPSRRRRVGHARRVYRYWPSVVFQAAVAA